MQSDPRHLENLESRRFLSATLFAHTLFIRGNDNVDDTIDVSLDAGGTNIQVAINADAVQTFAKSSVKRIIIRSYSGNDTINVDSAVGLNTSIFSGRGNDTIHTGSERDQIFADGGDDVIVDTGGINIVDCGAGNDSVITGDGTDVIFGGNGNDTLISAGGKDIITGDNGADSLDGGDGNDRMYGGRGNDTMYGMDGNDTMWGQRGDDVIDAGAGNDILGGIVGVNTLLGGEGSDTFHVRSTIESQTSDYDAATDIVKVSKKGD